MRDQDNAQFEAIKNLAANLAGQFIAGNLSFLSTGRIDYSNLVNAARQLAIDLFNSMRTDGDETIGVFNVSIENNGGKFKVRWGAGQDTRLVSPSDTELSAQFDHYHKGKYQIRVSLQRSAVYRLVNSNSNKVLDIPDSSTQAGRQLQQYTPHNGRSQAWFLKVAGGIIIPPFIPYAAPSGLFYIFSDLNGLCLDLRGGRVADGVPVQQYNFHGESNQRWGLCFLPQFIGEFVIPCLRGNKVLDIANASQDDHELLICNNWHGGGNQRWRIEKLEYPIERIL